MSDVPTPHLDAVSWDRYLKPIVEYGAPSLGLLALLLYAAARVAYDAFYNSLQLQPEEVGITYATVVTRAALGALSLLAFVVVLLLGLTFWISPNKILKGLKRPPGRFLLAGLTLVVVGVGSLLEDRYYPAGPNRNWQGDLILPVFGLFFAITGLFGLIKGVPAHVPIDRYGNAILAVTVMAAAAVIVLFSQGYGLATAQTIADGTDVPTGKFSKLYDLHGDRVCALWIGSDRPVDLDLSTPLFLLGQANGVMVLYRSRSRRQAQSNSRVQGPIRLPVSKIVLTPVQSGSLTCP